VHNTVYKIQKNTKTKKQKKHSTNMVEMFIFIVVLLFGKNFIIKKEKPEEQKK